MKNQTAVVVGRVALIVAITAATAILASCITYSDSDRLRIRDLRDFESLHKVNDQPLIGQSSGPLEGRHLEDEGMRDIYADDLAWSVYDGSTELPFPVGSLIVKDTHYLKDDGSQGRRWNITVMKKREPGYDPDHNDWEYVTAGPTRFIRVEGRVDLCIECHVYAQDRDYVFTAPR